MGHLNGFTSPCSRKSARPRTRTQGLELLCSLSFANLTFAPLLLFGSLFLDVLGSELFLMPVLSFNMYCSLPVSVVHKLTLFSWGLLASQIHGSSSCGGEWVFQFLSSAVWGRPGNGCPTAGGSLSAWLYFRPGVPTARGWLWGHRPVPQR